MRRNLITGLLISFFLMIAGNSFAAGDVLDEIMAAGELVVSTDANYAPQSFLNEDGELEGFDISVATEVARRLGVKVKFITPDWDLITAGKWGKRWDVSIGSMTPTKERKNALYFTIPYYAVKGGFAVHKNNKSIYKFSDLAGKTIGFGTETTYDRYMNRDLEIEDVKVTYQNWEPGELKTYPTDANAIEDLMLGDGARLDAAFTSRQTIISAIKEGCGNGCPIRLLDGSPFYEPMSFALDKSRANSDSLLKKLNEVLESMYKDGKLVELSMKFYNMNLIPER
jgi:polar amino acid transport system substrate-binding protein